MQGYYHTNIEMYRDTTDCKNIQKKVGAMQENMGPVINHLQRTKENKKQIRRGTTAEQERYNEVRKKQRQ